MSQISAGVTDYTGSPVGCGDGKWPMAKRNPPFSRMSGPDFIRAGRCAKAGFRP